MNYYVSGINTILDIKDFFFLILSSWSYFLFRITNSYTLYPGSFLVTTLCLLRGWPHLSHLCVIRKAPDREWVLTQCMWFKGKDEY